MNVGMEHTLRWPILAKLDVSEKPLLGGSELTRQGSGGAQRDAYLDWIEHRKATEVQHPRQAHNGDE
jgi:hypothetical protein